MSINKIISFVYPKDDKESVEQIFERFNSVDKVKFNAKSFEKRYEKVEKEIEEIDSSIEPDNSRLRIVFEI